MAKHQKDESPHEELVPVKAGYKNQYESPYLARIHQVVDRLWREKTSIAGLTIAVLAVTYVISRVTNFGFIEVAVPANAILGIVASAAAIRDVVRTERRQEDNQQFLELAHEIEASRRDRDETVNETRDDLAGYRRITRALDQREVELQRILENYSNSSKCLLMVFGHQHGPDGPVEDDLPDDKFIKWALQKYDLINITPFTWVIPPEVVAEEGLEQADQEKLGEWVDENIYSEFPEYRGEIYAMSVVDLDRVYSRSDLGDGEGRGTLVQKMIEESDSFDDEAYVNALAEEERVNLLEMVKKGSLVFFLPEEMDDETLEQVRQNQDQIKQYLEDGSLRGLAQESAKADLVKGLRESDIPHPEPLASDIVENAQLWQEKIQQA